MRSAELLSLRRCLVQLERVEFVQSVDGELEQLGRGGIVGCESHELSVLVSPDLSCLGHAVIKLSKRLLHDSDPVIGFGQLLLELQNRILMTHNRLRERLGVFRLVEILQAVRFLAVVVALLRLEQNHHLLDHGDDLGEINALPAERQSNQLKFGRRILWNRWRPPEFIERPLCQHRGAPVHLHQRWVLQSCFEEIELIIIVQQVDGVVDGEEFLGPALLALR